MSIRRNPKYTDSRLLQNASSLIIENHPFGLIVITKSLKVAEINSKALTILGVEKNDVIGKPFSNLGSLPSVISIQPVETHQEVTIRNKLHSVSTIPIPTAEQTVAGYYLIFRETAHETDSEAMLSDQDRFSLAVQAAGFDIWEIDLTTGRAKGGEKILGYLGYGTTQIPYTLDKLLSLVHHDDQGYVSQGVKDYLSGKNSIYYSEFRVRNANGSHHWVANHGQITQRDKAGNPTRLTGLLLTIDDRKRTEEKIIKQNEALKSANAEKDKFFSIIAHDLKGPFQGFIGLTELLSVDSSNLAPNEVKDIADSLRISAKNLYELLDNLLKWALIRRGHKVFSPQRIALLPLIQSTIDLYSSKARVKGIAIEPNIPHDYVVLADRESLSTIVRNLISNAVKFTPTKGSITITAKDLPKGMVEISVRDTGIGMDSEMLSKLFSIDQKVSRQGTANEPSTGLGLILCKELVEKHGGSILVDSKTGKGSNFRFSVPKAP